MSIRIDMHNLTNINGVVDAALELADHHSVRFIVGQGAHNSRQPELRSKVLDRIEQKVSITDAREVQNRLKFLLNQPSNMLTNRRKSIGRF